MKKQFVLRMAAFLLAMLMMLAVFAGCKTKKDDGDDEDVDTSPQAVLRNSLVSFVTDLAERDELKSLVNMYKNGSLKIEAEADLKEMMSATGGNAMEGDIAAGGKIYFGDKSLFLENIYADIYVPDEELDFDIEGDAYLSRDYFYLSNESVLGGTVGIIRGEMKSALESSALLEAFDSETIEILSIVMELYDGEEIDDAVDEATELIERYVEVVLDSIEKNAKYTEETKNVTVGGETVESRVITMTVDEKAVVGILNDLYDTVQNDKELRSLIVKYGDRVEEFSGMSGKEVEQAFDEILSTLGGYLETLDEDIPKGAIVVEVTTPKNASTLRKLVVSGREGDEDLITFVTLDAGAEGAKTSDCIELNIMDETVITYKVQKNDSNGYKSSLDVQYMATEWDENTGASHSYLDTMTVFTVDVDKKEETFEISIPDAGFTLGGTFKTSGDTTTIVFNSISMRGETLNRGFELTIVIDENDKMPSVVNKNDVTNIFDLTKGNWVDIGDRFEKVFGDIFAGKQDEPLYYVPAGYQVYDDGYVRFAYPEDWYQTSVSGTTVLVNPNGVGNNITLAYEAATDAYANMTTESFKTTMQPSLEASGMKISDAYVDHYWNNYDELTEISYTAESNGVMMDMSMLIINASDRTYIIAVTTVDYDYDTYYTVVDTLDSWY